MLYLQIFLCAGAAWYAAGRFLRRTARDAAGNAALSGLLCAILAFLLPLADVPGIWAGAAVPLLTLAQPVSRRDRLLALPLAAGGYGTLFFLCHRSRSLLPTAGAAVLACLLAAAFCALGTALQKLYPPENWQEYFQQRDQERFPVHPRHVWLALALTAAAELALPLTAGPPASPAALAALGGAYLLLHWGAVYAVCLMTAYRRERLAVLVDQDYRSEVQTFMSVIRSQRHDYNFHVQALSGLVASGDLAACRRYLDDLVRDSAAMNLLLPIKDPAVAALVNSFRAVAQQEGVELHMDIQNDLSCVVTSVYETNKIIGNLLQNAVDEVRTHPDKSFGIHLYILKRGENCIIHVANKIRPQGDVQTYLQDVYKPGRSSKPGHEGIGLTSVRSLLERYRGVVYSRLDGDVVHFVAKIPLRLEGEPL